MKFIFGPLKLSKYNTTRNYREYIEKFEQEIKENNTLKFLAPLIDKMESSITKREIEREPFMIKDYFTNFAEENDYKESFIEEKEWPRSRPGRFKEIWPMYSSSNIKFRMEKSAKNLPDIEGEYSWSYHEIEDLESKFPKEYRRISSKEEYENKLSMKISTPTENYSISIKNTESTNFTHNLDLIIALD